MHTRYCNRSPPSLAKEVLKECFHANMRIIERVQRELNETYSMIIRVV